MISTSVLFTSAYLPGDPSFDLGASCGLAEWRQDLPMLFKLLVGAGAQTIAWPAYDAGVDADCVLAAPMAQAQAAWQQLSALMEPPRDAAAAAAAASIARDTIGSLLASGQRWLVLDCVQLMEHDIGTADFDSALRRLRDDSAALHAALLRGDRETLAPLLRAEAPAIGHWASTGSAHLYVIEEVNTAELPFLQGISVRDWIEDVLCYAVAGGRPYAAGLVTPYGRWIAPLALGAVELTTVDAEEGWLIFAVKAPDGGGHWNGLMDLNGVIVLPASPAALYVISANLLQQVGPSGACRVLRLPDGALLHDQVNISQRNDGYFDFQRQLNDDKERNVHGVMDAAGKVVLPAHYSSVQDFGTGKRLAIVSQYVDGRYLFGLANTDGQLLAPCQYRLIDSATTSSPPKVRKRLIYAIDAQGLACMLTLDGQPAFTPRYPPAHHLLGVAVQDGFLYVASDGMAWSMDFSGRLLEQIGTLKQFQADISAQLGAALGLNAAPSASDTDDNSYTTAQLLAQVDRDQLRAIAAMLLLGDATLAARCVDLTLQYLAEEDAQGEYDGSTPEAACLFLLWSTASDVLGHGTTLDWKSVDEVEIIGEHIRIAALRDFRWPEHNDDGAGMADGLAAIGRHLAPHGLHLVNMLDGEDTYYLGVLRTRDIAALQRVAEEAGLPTLIY